MALNPGFPIVRRHYRLTQEWSLDLPGEFNRRIEDEAMCIWRPGLTIWVSVWSRPEAQSPAETIAWLKTEIAREAFDPVEDTEEGLRRLTYRLAEDADDDRVPAFYGFVAGQSGYVQLAIYFDREQDVEIAADVFRSVREEI